jgi:PAS domain S-box-containing protein
MQATLNNAAPFEATKGHAKALYQASQLEIYRRTDRMFAYLMVLQWLAGIAAALWISPRTWTGTTSQVHVHVWAAVFLGGAISSVPVALAWLRPGHAMTRHAVAVAQTLTSALLIHLTGGRIETHFHVFGSLAFLAFYRDWRVLITATVVVAADHMVRGLLWPQSVFGVVNASQWRWLEHAGWVVFEDVFLVISIRQSLQDMRDVATRRAELENYNLEIERKVVERTADLQRANDALELEIAEHKRTEAALRESEDRLGEAQRIAHVGSWDWDVTTDKVTWSDELCRIFGIRSEEFGGTSDDFWRRVHPDDLAPTRQNLERSLANGDVYSCEFRVLRPDGSQRVAHGQGVVTFGADGKPIRMFGAVQDVTDRKKAEAEIVRANRELHELSREAGMAEVATNVLHNVGNVLNSVNVAAETVAYKVRQFRVGSLKNVAALLRDNETDLPNFLTIDPRGKELPGYLVKLADSLAAPQTAIIEEMDSLRKNVEHIKGIVAMQQNYARRCSLVEPCSVVDLVEDAIRINSAALTRHHVELVREFDASVPEVITDRHKVLHILVNLLGNAKHAMAETAADKTLVVRVTSNGDHMVKVAVCDNGMGIPSENLPRIFQHGFTTKKDGHGFGLHSGALAAKELGGALTVQSDGPGRGSVFTLALPVQSNPPR